MPPKKLIIDCDGVLYPSSELSVKDIVDAMKDVYRNVLHLSGQKQQLISAKTIEEGHLGVFNYIKEMCYSTGYDFDKFCQQMADRTDFSRIKENQALYEQLKKQATQRSVNIFSNNSRAHIEKVMQKVFNRTGEEVERDGIKIYDITATERNGYFHPKQSANGFPYFLQKINAEAKDCILLDDTARNIKVARQHGLEAVLISDERPLSVYLQALTTPLQRQKGKTHE